MSRYSLLFLLLFACSSGVVETADDKVLTQLDVHGQVISIAGPIPVPGARVLLHEGEIERAVVTTDAEGRFAFNPRTACGWPVWSVYTSHHDYIVTGLQHTRPIECNAQRQDVTLRLAPRSKALVFHPAPVAVAAGDSIKLSVTIIYVNGEERDMGPMLWSVTGPGATCGAFVFAATSAPVYVAPAAVPPDGACGGPAGRVRVDLLVYDDIRMLVPGVTDHTYITIVA
jgi:hypothetical protein